MEKQRVSPPVWKRWGQMWKLCRVILAIGIGWIRKRNAFPRPCGKGLARPPQPVTERPVPAPAGAKRPPMAGRALDECLWGTRPKLASVST